MKNNLASALLVLALIAAPPIWAQAKPPDAMDLQALRTAVRTDKKALVASTLDLTPAEAKKFWPIYDAYQRDLDLTNRRMNRAVEDFVALNKPLSNAYAKNLSAELIAADEFEIKARRKMYNKLMRALPASKAARYLQLESKIRAMQDYDIANAIPLVK